MKYTPGPWQCDVRVGCVAVYPANVFHNCLEISKDNFIHYKQGFYNDSWSVDEEVLADAHLIAAAPEMYEILKKLLENFGYAWPAEYKELVEQVLQKARGEG